MRSRPLYRCAALFVAVYGIFSAPSAFASKGSVYAVNCATCATLQDFILAARNQANQWFYNYPGPGWPPAYTGLYVITSGKVARTALVNIQGYSKIVLSGGHYTAYFYTTGYNAVKLDGTPATADADLLTTEVGLFGSSRTPSNASSPIKLDPMYGGSYINNDAVDADTSTGVNAALLAKGIDPNSIPAGTVLKVEWPDGTNAWVIKNSAVATYLWSILPGTARDKQGHPIDKYGNIVANPNQIQGKPTGAPDSPSTFPTATGPTVTITLSPGNLPQGDVTITWPDGSTTTDTTYLPPGG